ncbi:Alpha/beta hydrolase fold-1 [Mycena alexandri]|uniref:Alpha/beta hydrolase fold-1 n=1 Tax=Mycena alexandri TaxID=1745969 RepID=A0AAD6X6Z2_9AGAR|nr:Alpha/beta hydrolase fold-1 [Mycena alexandri]
MSPTKPEIIIIPGSFCPLKYYDPVVADLKAHGYSVHGVELETVGRRDTAAPGMYDDAAAIAALVTRLANEGKDVVLVPHSYGGVPTCESAKGLAKTVREKEGKAGGIVRIVFVSAIVPKEGESLREVTADSGVPVDYVGVEGEYLYLTDLVKAAAINLSDLSPEEGLGWAKKFTQHSVASFGEPLTYAAYKDIPASWVFLEQDKCVPPELQNKMMANMETVMGGRKVERFPVDVGHCINMSQPATFAKVVRKAIGDTV